MSKGCLAVIGLVLAMCPGAGCRSCDAIGCYTGVFVDFPKEFAVADLPLDVTICADSECETTTVDPITTDGPSIPVMGELALDDRKERDVVVRVEIRSNDTLLIAATGTGRLRRSQPNGAGCDPVCYQTLLTFDEASNTLMQH